MGEGSGLDRGLGEVGEEKRAFGAEDATLVDLLIVASGSPL